MTKSRLNLELLAIETFELGEDPVRQIDLKGSSGAGCTVDTTCSPTCCNVPTTEM